jgi:hypothetical protein
VLWTSPDGLTRTLADDADGSFDAPNSGINAMAIGGPGFVAVGASDNKPAVWTSPDGLDWTPPQQLTSASGYLTNVMAGGLGLITRGMVVLDPTAILDSEQEPGAWTSADGTSWSPAAHDAVGVSAEADSWTTDIIATGPGTRGHRDRGLPRRTGGRLDVR